MPPGQRLRLLSVETCKQFTVFFCFLFLDLVFDMYFFIYVFVLVLFLVLYIFIFTSRLPFFMLPMLSSSFSLILTSSQQQSASPLTPSPCLAGEVAESPHPTDAQRDWKGATSFFAPVQDTGRHGGEKVHRASRVRGPNVTPGANMEISKGTFMESRGRGGAVTGASSTKNRQPFPIGVRI